MSGFDAAWLRMREPFDAAARDRNLATRFAAALPAHRRPKRVIDLASGTGSGFRALAPVMGGDQDWLLIDHDPSLISAQRSEIASWAGRNGWRCEEVDHGVCVRTGSATWIARARTFDVATSLDDIDFAACDGITTSAFLDLVSGDWLDRLSNLMARVGVPLLAMLSIDGRRAWRPPLPVDAHVDRAFRLHQRRDKGFGPAQGERATAYLADRLAAAGYEVSTAPSDWRIGAEHRRMLLRMVEESAAVASESEPGESPLFTEWSRERHEQIRSDLLSLEVGHLDLLALPAGQRR